MAKGSIEKRGETTWRLRVDLGYNPDGRRNRPTKKIELEDPSLIKLSSKCRKYKDAGRKLREFLDDELAAFKREVLSGEYVAPKNMTFEQFVRNEWWPKYASIPENLSPKTAENYMSDLETTILPVFGHKQIDQIKTMHIVTFVDGLRKSKNKRTGKTISQSRVLYLYKVLKNVLSKATEWRVIGKNPMEDLKQPKVGKTKQKYYSEQEAFDIIAKMYELPDVWRLYFLGCMIGGFRRGELLGLEWPNVDYDNGSLSIDTTIPLTKNGKAVEKGTKNEVDRAVDMPRWYMDDQQAWQHQCKKNRLTLGTKWQGGDKEYVFHSGFGKPYHASTPSGRWRKFRLDHNLKQVKLHGLRHSSATILLEMLYHEGKDESAAIKIIQKRLGHSKYSTTADIYTHITKHISRISADRFEHFRPQFVPKAKNS